MSGRDAAVSQLDKISAASRKLLARLTGKVILDAMKGIESLLDGSRLTLQRLDDYLNGMGIRETTVIGQKFDSELMNAIELVADSDSDKGTVIRIHRRGYEMAERIIRVAEVGVAK